MLFDISFTSICHPFGWSMDVRPGFQGLSLKKMSACWPEWIAHSSRLVRGGPPKHAKQKLRFPYFDDPTTIGPKSSGRPDGRFLLRAPKHLAAPLRNGSPCKSC